MGDEEAEALKLEANQFFAEHKYAKAVVVYSKALELAPTNVKLLSNRAFAHLRECR
jgi:Flp pilus assembly protein TadD